eukprot:Hpha_TRINITY_DN11831_c2_g1::TRINITY_DN11831_c2_g1_i1::g.2144::m.2144
MPGIKVGVRCPLCSGDPHPNGDSLFGHFVACHPEFVEILSSDAPGSPDPTGGAKRRRTGEGGEHIVEGEGDHIEEGEVRRGEQMEGCVEGRGGHIEEEEEARGEGLLIFARVDPACAGRAGSDALTPVEVAPSASVRNVIRELRRLEAVRGQVDLQWQGRRLELSEALADVGLCPESTADVLPKRFVLPKVACGYANTMVILPDGALRYWGGRANPWYSSHMWPRDLPCAPMQMVCGPSHTAGLLQDGNVMVWGRRCRFIPEFQAKVVQLAVGCGKTAALLETGVVVCWNMEQAVVCPTPDIRGTVVQVALQNYANAVVALLDDGTIRFWKWGQRVLSNIEARIPCSAVQVSAGDQHCIALLENGGVIAWGDNTGNQCSPIPAFRSGVRQVAAGGKHNVAILNNGEVVCWGSKWQGACKVPRGLRNVVEVAAGSHHNIARLEDGKFVCWGWNRESQCVVPDDLMR